MANWKTYRISEVVTEIDDEKYVLPVIQRELVWSKEKIELLFDTVLKGNSFGGIIVIEEEKGTKPLFASRMFSKDGNKQNSQNLDKLDRTQFFVIDGQQRLQSFYIGLKGSYFGENMYFDLFSDYQNDFEFEFASEPSKLPKSTKEQRPIQDRLWICVKDLLRKLKDSDERKTANGIIQENAVEDNKRTDTIKENVYYFYKNIVDMESIGVAKVSVDKTLDELENRQKIVELFVRLNDGGTKLSALDLVASTLKGFDYKMESFLREMNDEFSDIGLTSENLVKLIFLLRDNPSKEMSAIEAPDADFAVKNMERVRCTAESLRKFLICANLHDYYVNTKRAFIPLFFVAYHIFHKGLSDEELKTFWNNNETSNEDFKPMKVWLINSLLNGVFRSRGAGWVPYKTGIKKILDVLKNFKNKTFPVQDLFRMYMNHPIHFTTSYSIENLDNFDKEFVFYIVYGRASQIRANDIDHIMPYNLLESHFAVDAINSVKNFQLLDYGTNRGAKNGKPFLQWINNSNYVKDKPEYVKRHLIPSDETLWTEDKFIEFSTERGKLLMDKIIEYMN